jgi:hypothetical protein
MRGSLVGRFVSHPAITFTSGRGAASRARLGLMRSTTVYHRPSTRSLSVRLLRSHTSHYRFAPVAPVARVAGVRAAHSIGSARGRRA